MKSPIEEVVRKAYRTGGVTLIGIGPMSKNVVESCIELAKEKDFPLMFIASRNQVDLKKFGGGYACGWDQFEFVENIRRIADRNDYSDYYICRDHGGPWQRDEERGQHLPLDEAMSRAKESYLADIQAGFDLLMIDPTKDPFVKGKVVDIDFVLEKTVELIDFCEQKRKELHLPAISYEVGTEETNGGLTDLGDYDNFLVRLNSELNARNLPNPLFAVGQTGTLVQSTRQAGVFDYVLADKLSTMAVRHGAYLKEHNADYLTETSLLEHIPARVTAANVAPEFGTMETRAYVILDEIESSLLQNGVIDKPSGFRTILLEEAIKTNRWRKWVTNEKASATYEEVMRDEELSREVLDIAGHYSLNKKRVQEGRDKLYHNLKKAGIEGNGFVKEYIKSAIMKYVRCFNMGGLGKKIKSSD